MFLSHVLGLHGRTSPPLVQRPRSPGGHEPLVVPTLSFVLLCVSGLAALVLRTECSGHPPCWSPMPSQENLGEAEDQDPEPRELRLSQRVLRNTMRLSQEGWLLQEPHPKPPTHTSTTSLILCTPPPRSLPAKSQSPETFPMT